MVWLFLVLGGCGGPGSSPEQTPAGTPQGTAPSPGLTPGGAACGEPTCDDPSAVLTDDFDTVLERECPQGFGSVHICQTPQGERMKVIEKHATFCTATWRFDLDGTPVAGRVPGCVDNSPPPYCCGTQEDYTLGPAPEICTKVEDLVCGAAADTALASVQWSGEADIGVGYAGADTVAVRSVRDGGDLCIWVTDAVDAASAGDTPRPQASAPCEGPDGSPCAFAFDVILNGGRKEAGSADCTSFGLYESFEMSEGRAFLDDYRVGGISYGPTFLYLDPLAEGLTGAWLPAHERAAGLDGTTFSFDWVWDQPIGYVP